MSDYSTLQDLIDDFDVPVQYLYLHPVTWLEIRDDLESQATASGVTIKLDPMIEPGCLYLTADDLFDEPTDLPSVLSSDLMALGEMLREVYRTQTTGDTLRSTFLADQLIAMIDERLERL